MPVVVVSPHLDDGVFGCGQLLAANPGSVVITVFAGRPPEGRLGSWDRHSFDGDRDVMWTRREEDRRALARLDASAVHLDLLDAQYRLGDDVTVDDVACALDAVLAGIEGPVYLPLGAEHVDHVLVSDAGMNVVPDERWVLYEELPYARVASTWIDERRDVIGGLSLAQPVLGPRSVKADAAREYVSQRDAMRKGWMLVLTEERYWHRTAGS